MAWSVMVNASLAAGYGVVTSLSNRLPCSSSSSSSSNLSWRCAVEQHTVATSVPSGHCVPRSDSPSLRCYEITVWSALVHAPTGTGYESRVRTTDRKPFGGGGKGIESSICGVSTTKRLRVANCYRQCVDSRHSSLKLNYSQ